jgi:hypothetical protein
MDDKLVTLVRRLEDKAGEVSWEKTEEEETFETDFAGFGVQIGRDDAEGEEPLYKLRLFDTEGEFLDEFTDDDLTVILNRTEPTEPSEMFEVMKAIHRTARRSAMGVGKAVDAILEALAED